MMVGQTDERVKDVHFADETISIDLMDGQTIIVPLVWYHRVWISSSGNAVVLATECIGTRSMKT
jgi:hypothetical protein